MIQVARPRRVGLLLALTLLAVSSGAQTAETLTPDQAQEDFRVFRTALEEAHPGLYRYATRAEMDTVFEGIRAGLTASLTRHELYLRLQTAIVAIRDGHTKFHPDTVWSGLAYFNRDRQLPAELHILRDRAWVLRSPDPALVAGSEILAIEDTPMADLVNRLLERSTFVDGNGPGARRLDVGRHFGAYYGNYIGARDTYRLLVLDPGMTEARTVVVGAVTADALEAYLTRPREEPVSLTFPDPTTALLTVRSFQDEGGPSIPSLLRRAFTQIEERGPRKLIIDLRDNEGGTDAYGSLLYSYIATKPFPYYYRIEVTRRTRFSEARNMDLPWYFPLYRMLIARDGDRFYWTHKPELRVQQPGKRAYDGKVVMLINGRSYSVTAEVAAVARSQGRALFVGEETAGAYGGNTSGFFAITRLPNSRLIVGIPLWGYYTAVLGVQPLDRGIIPEHVVAPTIEDLLRGTDPVLQRALEL